MHWEERLLAVFDDLEQQAEGLALEARDAEVAELGRAEYAAVDVAARLHGAVASRLRASEVAARTITVKVRFGDFVTITRSTTPWRTRSPTSQL